MHSTFAQASFTRRASLLTAIFAFLVLSAVPAARAQFNAPATTPVHDPAALKPPAGARVAIVEFEDMECPDCANANAVLSEAAAKYNIPWVRHDFPLPFHPWSFQAAVNARWFDTKSKKIGDDYRDAVFANQPSITSLDVLRQFTENYAKNHNIALPFAIDPQGKFAAAGQGRLRTRPAHRHRAHPHHLDHNRQQQRRALRRSRRPHQALPAHRPGHRRHQIRTCKNTRINSAQQQSGLPVPANV